ncbi:Lsr2 family DNA-binding protein [Streptomyces griseorubiginosus]|uniref:Lsr2 family DNA-binding protein n=1 Tax=Streptomyces griseorubiginosus TaxID=67304 RepID=UPI0036EA9BA2
MSAFSTESSEYVGTWIDVFPWVEYLDAPDLIDLQRLGGPAQWWSKESPAQTAMRRASMEEVFDLLSGILLSSGNLADEDCAILFPALHATTVIEDLDMENDGATAALAEFGVLTLGDLRGITPHDLRLHLPLTHDEVVILLSAVMRAVALPNESSHAVAVTHWFSELDSVEQSILLLHRCASKRQELSTLAIQHRIPLERLQELCDELSHRLDAAMATSSALRAAVADFDHVTHTPTPMAQLQCRRPWLGGFLPGSDVSLVSLLSSLRHAEVQEQWICRPSVREQVQKTLSILGFEEDEVMALSVARRILSQRGWVVAYIDAWLDFCGIPSRSGQLQFNGMSTSELGDRPRRDAQPAPIDRPPAKNLDFAPQSGMHDHDGDSESPSSAGDTSSQADAVAIRAWARGNGFAIGERGRIPRVIQEAYAAALGDMSQAASPRDVPPPPLTRDDAPRSPDSALAEEFATLATLLNPDEQGITIGSLLRLGEELPQQAQDIVHRILNATLGENGWIVDREENSQSSVGSPVRKTLTQRAREVLQAADHPLSTGELTSRMGDTVNERSLKVQLAADLRFTRSDIDSWALAEWQLRPYTSVRELVEEEVDKAGGSIESDELMKVLTQAFSIKESTLRQVVSSAPFTARGGRVQRLTNLDSGRYQGDTHRVDEPADNSAGVQLARDLGLDF